MLVSRPARLLRGDDRGVCSDVTSAENAPKVSSGSRLPQWVLADAKLLEEPTRLGVWPHAIRIAMLPREAAGPRNPRRPIQAMQSTS